jgi:hypothetical protein
MTIQTFRPIETPIGFVGGRDAIYLDDVKFDFWQRTLTLTGRFNGILSSSHVSEWVHYALTFTSIVAFKFIELESWEHQGFAIRGASSFDEVVDSGWLAEMEPRVAANAKHYIVQAYDEVFEVICYNFELTITGRDARG